MVRTAVSPRIVPDTLSFLISILHVLFSAISSPSVLTVKDPTPLLILNDPVKDPLLKSAPVNVGPDTVTIL